MGQVAAPPKGNDFTYLDSEAVRAKYQISGEPTRMRFFVEGVNCANCVRKLEGLRINGLLQLRFEMGSHLAHVEIDPTLTTFAQVANAIDELGFRAVPLASTTHEEERMKIQNRMEIVRLAVAGACAGNIMGFAFAIYFGLAGEWANFFSWMSFVLYIPVLTFVAWPFYRGAWIGIKNRRLSIDLPMAVASLAGFIFSTSQLIRGRPEVYFDSISGFLFLILVARFLQRRLQNKTFRDAREFKEVYSVRKIALGRWEWIPVDQLKINESFLLRANEILPVDAELIRGTATFSLAWLSGEAKPRVFSMGSVIPAGARLLSKEIALRMRVHQSDTEFGRILDETAKFSMRENRAVLSSDRWSQILLLIVFLIAGLFAIVYWSVSPEEALRRSIALIVIACPCAMAFGTPLAVAYSLRRARRSGLIVRDANALLNASQIKTAFFDKTGTLTDSEMRLKPQTVPTVFKKIILSLESQSLHPIAFAFRRAFIISDPLPPVKEFQESPGMGVSGYIYGRSYSLKKRSSNSVGCTLFEDDKPLYDFEFEAGVRPDANLTINELKRMGITVGLISGDEKHSVDGLAADLGIDSTFTHAVTSPSEKERIVSSTSNSLMVGDGVNDSLALMKAHVGIAVSGAMGAALKSAPIYLATEKLSAIPDLISISKDTHTLIRRNLTIAVIYNVTAGSLALLGQINPFVAALLMPVASGILLLHTHLAGKP